MIKTLYRTWLEFTGWLLCLVWWLFWLQGQVSWWEPCVLWVMFMVLYFLTRQLGFDAGAIPFVAVLLLIGWVFLARLNPTWATAQTWGALVGCVGYVLGLWIGRRQPAYPLAWAVSALGLVVITTLFGISVGGARAWITLFGQRFQPVELARIFLIIYLAQYFVGGRSKWELAIVLGGFFVCLAWQRDLGPALLVFFVFCWMSLHWKFTWTKLFAYLGVTAAGFFVAYQWFPHLRTRAIAWLWPWDYLDSKGYQVLQGLFALRSGGIVGQGLGGGLVHVIPNVHTDYLFAVIGEELGILGTFSLLVVYLSLAFWALRLVHSIQDRCLRMTGLGLTLLLHLQVFLVVGGILRLVPFTGMTLPFVSYGSTSLVAQLTMLGMVTGLGGRKGGSLDA